MLYASSKSSVIALATSEAGIEVAKKVRRLLTREHDLPWQMTDMRSTQLEATNPDEITIQTLHDEFHPKQEQKSGFARPKRPGRR